jgi:hypothetical protein
MYHDGGKGVPDRTASYRMAGSRHDLKSQGSCGTNDSAGDRLQLEMLEVIIPCLDFGNFVHVFETDGAHYFMSGTRGTLFQAGDLLEEVGGRRRFCDKSERPVWLDVNHGRDWDTGFDVSGPGVEFFAKVHGFDTTRAERWADGRTWRSLSCTNQETLKEGRFRVLDGGRENGRTTKWT